MPTNEILSEALALWKKGDALEAGKLIFENLPAETRPQWAARVLRLVVDRTRIKSEPVELAIDIANTPADWGKAHGAFSTVRKATLNLERQKSLNPRQALLLNQLYLAESVAKVAYNATNPWDGFDEDSGWWIARCLKDILDSLNDEKFSASAWAVLAFGDGTHEQGG